MKKVVILGPESTGKSTLATKLAHHFNGCAVDEFAREYLDRIQGQYTFDDLLLIAKGQIDKEISIEKECFDQGKTLVFYDSDITVMKIWSEYKFGRCHPWIIEQYQKRIYDLYLLTYPDLKWVQDPLRENPGELDVIYNLYLKDIEKRDLNYVIIKGKGIERTQKAIEAVNELLST